MISQSLYKVLDKNTIVDTIIIGRGVGMQALASIGAAADLVESVAREFRATMPFIALLNRAVDYAREEM